ncbi:MAG TPA: hypothetical protein PLX96_06065 [Candidatus Omnitrophota bacterium]|nr:hypothetical protein [Candidatus Omnitrophota bacterium]
MRCFLMIVAILAIIVLAGGWWVWGNLPEIAGWWIEQNSRGVLDGPVEIGDIQWVGSGVRLEKIAGKLRTRQGPAPFVARSVASVDPLTFFYKKKQVRFSFEGLKPEGSDSPGVYGEFVVHFANEFSLDLAAEMDKIALEDLRWIDPANLAGASGALKGSLRYSQMGNEPPHFEVNLDSPEPGGFLQAKFFDLFLPYLPASSQKQRVEQLASTGERLVKFKVAGLTASMPDAHRMKIFLRILILDYNLDLKLNVEVRTDSEDAFLKIAQWMGVVEVQS